MSQITIRALSENEVQQIHETSLRVLQEIGIDVAHEDLRVRLLAAGAKAGVTNSRVLIPAGMVAEALAHCPRDIVLGSVRGERYPLPATHRLYSSCVIDPFMMDYADGQRPPSLADCATNARLIDALDPIGMPYKMDLDFSDATGEASLLESNFAYMANMSKHYVCAPHDATGARTWLEMSEIMAGAPLRENPVMSALVSPISPLTLDRGYLELIETLAPAGILLILLPCPQAGATSPLPLAGTVVDFNTENLAAIALIQTLWPGAPLLYHNVAMAFNMKAGCSSLGGPEKALCAVAGVDLARFYNLPAGCAGTATDSVRYDLQNGAETMAQLLLCVGSGADMITGIGSIGNGMGTSAEQILFDCDLIRLAEYLCNGIRVDEDRLAFASLQEAGPGGSFLLADNTLQFLRSGEHFTSGSFERSGSSAAKRCMYENLHARAQEILAKHQPKVPEDRLEALQRYVQERGVNVSLARKWRPVQRGGRGGESR